MIHYNISKRFMMMLFFVVFSITMLFVSNYFLKSASADQMVPRYEGEIVFPSSNEAVVNTNHTVSIMPTQNTTVYVNTNHTVSIMPMQNTTVYDKTTDLMKGFSNI